MEEAHRDLKISPAQIDQVAAGLGPTLDYFKVPDWEKEEVLAAYSAHKDEVTEGYLQPGATLYMRSIIACPKAEVEISCATSMSRARS